MANKAILLMFCAVLLLTICAAIQAQVTVKTVCHPSSGWMADGWGEYKFFFKNDGKFEAKIIKWTAYWEANGKPIGESWGGDLDLIVAPGQEVEKTECNFLSQEIIDKTKPETPHIVGTFTIETSDDSGQKITKELPFKVDIPEGKLPEPTKLVKGKYIGIELMESRFKNFKNLKKILELMDQCYEAMHELTGYTPFDGKLTIIKECPRHPWGAYAGNPVVLNTDRVPKTIEEIEEGFIPFGWVHEVGHNFDMPDDIGNWYIWNYNIGEMQANWKLVYAYETIKNKDFNVKWNTGKSSVYQSGDKWSVLSSKQFSDSNFLFIGDNYLADPSRTWESMSGDEFHSFMQRLVRVYSWEPIKAWYRTYSRFHKMGLKAPDNEKEKVQLMAAILSYEIGVDLVPVFQRWRFPVTNEDIDAMMKKYPIDQKSTK